MSAQNLIKEELEELYQKNRNDIKAIDILEVRRKLMMLEKIEGITELHHRFSELLCSSADLITRTIMKGAVGNFSLSPCRRYLAIGSGVGEEYEDGGNLQIWDVAMARCLRSFEGIPGGVGWFGEYQHMIQWSSDSKYLAIANNTNVISILEPFRFSDKYTNIVCIDITCGWSRPPAFSLNSDFSKMFVATWQEEGQGGCILPLNLNETEDEGGVEIYDSHHDLVWISDYSSAMNEDINVSNPYEYCQWTQDGEKVIGYNSHKQFYIINVEKQEIENVVELKKPISIDQQSNYIAHHSVGLVFYSAKDGLPTVDLPMVMGASEGVWSDSGLYYAMIVRQENEFMADAGVHIYKDRKYFKTLALVPREDDWDFSDGSVVAFSEDESQIACINNEGKIEIFSLNEEKQPKVISPKYEVYKINWGVEQTLIALSKESIEFWCTLQLECKGDFIIYDGENESVPLLSESIFAECNERIIPLLIEGQWEWAVIEPRDQMLCPQNGMEELDKSLAYSIGNCVWPFRWGAQSNFSRIYHSIDDLPRNAKILKSLKGQQQVAKIAHIDIDMIDIDESTTENRLEYLRNANYPLNEIELPLFNIKHFDQSNRISPSTLSGDEIQSLLGKVVIYPGYFKADIGTVIQIKENNMTLYAQKSGVVSTTTYDLETLEWICVP